MESVIVDSFERFLNKEKMNTITIYKLNSLYGSRLFTNGNPTKYIILSDDIEFLRNKMPIGWVKIVRSEDDDPTIIETYL
jgi:hypothetical protein